MDEPPIVEASAATPPSAEAGARLQLPSTQQRARWSFARRALFCFAAAYFVLYTFPFPVSALPTWTTWKPRLGSPAIPEKTEVALEAWDDGVQAVIQWTTTFWQRGITRVGTLLGREVIIQPTGSGDTLYAYVQSGTQLVAALLAALIAAALLRGRPPPRLLRAGLVVVARYYLAFTVIAYGSFKLVKSQFPDPHLERLLQPFGEASPMGLVWTFMGVSAPYNFFAGAAEALGGALLLFRRTTTLGALVTFVVMANVTMLNFAYDVPVKLFSAHLLLLAGVLAALDGRRLLALFLQNRSTAPRDLRPLCAGRFARASGFLFKVLLIVHAVWGNVVASRSGQAMYAGQEEPELYGIWDVQRFERDGIDVPPLATDDSRWQRLIVDKRGYAKFFAMDGDSSAARLTLEQGAQRTGTDVVEPDTLTLRNPAGSEPSWKHTMEVERPSKKELVLSGDVDGQHLRVTFTRRLPEDFPLVNRGFHWINELPYNK